MSPVDLFKRPKVPRVCGNAYSHSVRWIIIPKDDISAAPYSFIYSDGKTAFTAAAKVGLVLGDLAAIYPVEPP